MPGTTIIIVSQDQELLFPVYKQGHRGSWDLRWVTPKITVVNGKAKLKPKLHASKLHSFPGNHFSHVESCSSICYGPKSILLQNNTKHQPGCLPKEQPTHLTKSGSIPSTPVNQSIKTQQKDQWKGNRSLKDSNVWRNCCQFCRNRMYFLELMAWRVLTSSCSWIPLFSVPCLPAEPWLPRLPWLVRSPSLGSLDSTHQALIWDTGSGGRQQRQGPNFYNVFWVTCPPISAFLEEKVILKDCLLRNRWHPKIPTEMEEVHSQLFSLPHEDIFQVQNHSFTMYK